MSEPRKLASVITAKVRYEKNEAAKSAVKCPTVTHCTFYLGERVVAWGVVGGKFSEADAVKELRKSPKRFKEGTAFADAKLLKLV